MNKHLGQILCVAVLVAMGYVTVARWVGSWGDAGSYTRRPIAIMGTECKLTVVAGKRSVADRALAEAEAALRGVEARMSTYLAGSEVSRLNQAPAGREIPLSEQTLNLLRVSRKLADQTGGAFDVTVRPLIQLWKRAAKENRLPTEREIQEARSASSWNDITLTETGAIKARGTASVDLGGIAKGLGIDLAAEAIIGAGLQDGLVDVGGDVRCFGRRADGQCWTVAVENPFQPGGGEFLTKLTLRGGAVATSGNYRRFREIEGRRYSHIIDPRTGRPVEVAPSVTVVAPTAVIADAWATALSVLGPDGFDLIPAGSGIEAMIVTGGPEDYRVHQTPGFNQ